jgi:hypothetical protein
MHFSCRTLVNQIVQMGSYQHIYQLVFNRF